NSGVKYRTQGKLGLEYQVLDDLNHRDNHISSHLAGSLYDLVSALRNKPLLPVGEWNQAKIIAQGNLVQHWMNGEKIVEISIDSPEWKDCFQKSKYKAQNGFGSWTGPILLQDHSDPAWFRNLRIKKLGLLLFLCIFSLPLGAETFFANGIKIGEVTQDSAILWTRLTRHATAHIDGEKFRKVPKHAPQIPKGKSLADMEGAVSGIAGSVRISWQSQGVEATRTEWLPVDEDRDFTRKLDIRGLLPGRAYEVQVESRSAKGKAGQTIRGKFRTAPSPEMMVPIQFVVTSCQDYPRRDTPDGHQIYPNMLKLDPDFFIHTGDIEYYDKPMPWATNRELARFKWNRLYGLPHLAHFHTQLASYFMKDDHDTTSNDSWPGVDFMDLTWEQGKDLFQEQFPVRKNNYRTVRWGKDLQIWMVEGRDFRSPNNQPDGPEKTIWGKI
ncbi:MAG: DUF1080 domain-containing protein, partial [Opitutae bacterium]|nr:DUF1080 domain-containing protein [Opitutae bacterium]